MKVRPAVGGKWVVGEALLVKEASPQALERLQFRALPALRREWVGCSSATCWGVHYWLTPRGREEVTRPIPEVVTAAEDAEAKEVYLEALAVARADLARGKY